MRIPLKRLHANSAASDHTGQVRYCKSAFGRRCTARCEPDGARNSVATVYKRSTVAEQPWMHMRVRCRGPAGAARPVRVLWVLQHVWAACWIWTKQETAYRGVLFTFSLPPAVRPVSILAAPHVLPSYVTTHSPAPVSVDLKTLNGARAHADGKAYS